MDEKAKAIQDASKLGAKALDSADKLGGFLSKVFGTLPEDVVGIIGADWLHHIRIRNAVKLSQRTEEIIKQRGIKDTIAMSPSIAIPLLESAQDESRDELQELWARLLANGMDPDRSQSVRISIISIVKSFDPLDAIILEKAFLSSKNGTYCDLVPIRSELKPTQDEFEISIQNLVRLGCCNRGTTRIEGHNTTSEVIEFTPLGREVIKACSL